MNTYSLMETRGMTFRTRPLAPGFGLEILGVDLGQPLCEETIEALGQAWTDANGLLLFRGQRLSPEQHVALAGALGEVYVDGAKNNAALGKYYLPGHPAVFRVSNKKQDGMPLGREDAGTYWHADASWQSKPPRGSLLHALELPAIGGDTMFADMHQAYETLSPPIQKMLEGLNAEHSVGAEVMRTSYSKEYEGRLDQAMAKRAIHPVIMRHPVSGKKALFVNPGFTARILELAPRESDTLLSLLFEHAV